MALPADLSKLEFTEVTSDANAETWGAILEMCEKAEKLHQKVAHDGEDIPQDQILRNYGIKLCLERMQELKNDLLVSSGVRCTDPEILKEQLYQSTNSRDRLHHNLTMTGLQIHEPIVGDGNCFFRAICSQLQRMGLNEIGPGDLRAEVVSSLRNTTLIQVQDRLVDLADFMPSGADAYCDSMAQDGEWADHVTVVATANYLQRDVLIVTSSPDTGPDNLISWVSGKDGYSGDPLLIGHVWENHYESLSPKVSVLEDVKAGETSNTTHHIPSTVTPPVNKAKPMCDPDAAFKTMITNKYCKFHNRKGLIIQRLPKNVSEEEYTQCYLREQEDLGKGRFSWRHAVGMTTQYYCERHGKPRGNKQGPHKTRCNSCPAYVSFRYVNHNGKRAAIIHSQLDHAGHDLNDPSERRVAQLDDELVELIQSHVEDKTSTSTQILAACLKWATSKGHHDCQDRRYFPTPRDVQQVISAYKASQRYHSDDSVAVSILCTEILKDKIVYYQALDRSISQPLLIVYQDNKQFNRMDEYGKKVVFLDATYKGITSYGYAFYTCIARTATGHGIPLFYIISSEDTTDALSKALQKVKDHAHKCGITFSPMSFMVDKDVKEHEAIRNVFPTANIILCWFHVLQAIYRWMNKHDSGISGIQNAEVRRSVITYIRRMKNCTEAEAFNSLAEQLDTEMPNATVSTYIQNNWVTCGEMWSNYGRRIFHGDHETNNLAERFFLGLKYHHMARQANKRVDELLMLLSVQVNPIFDYLERLAAVGRITNKNTKKEKRTNDLVQSMLQQDWRRKTFWSPGMVCVMPSQQDPNIIYAVDLPRATCECVAAAQEGLCKHYRLALILAAELEMDPEEGRKEKARVLYEKGSFLQADGCLEVYDEFTIGYVDLKTRHCVCVAFSHGFECVCIKVAAMVAPPEKTILTADYDESLDHPSTAPMVDSVEGPDRERNKAIQQLPKILAAMELQPFTATMRRAAKHIDTAYKTIFGKHINVTKERKIHPLKTGRKLAKPRKKNVNDHCYGSKVGPAKKSRNLADGGFRRTNRALRTQRNPFGNGEEAKKDSEL